MTGNTTPHTFIAESRELLRDMEGALLTLERTPGDGEALHAVFRAMHTIKGSSGVFGFDAIVEFTHVMEELVDEARSGRLAIDGALVALLLECGDHVAMLVDCLHDDQRLERLEEAQAAGDELLAQLRCFLPQDGDTADDVPSAEVPAGAGAGAQAANTAWHIVARFHPDVLRHGMDPLSVLRYLRTLGTVERVRTVLDALPPPDDMDAEACYLGVDIRFATAQGREAIEDAFEYAGQGGEVAILPPGAPLASYADVLQRLSPKEPGLGEAWVAMGALTADELAAARACAPAACDATPQAPGQPAAVAPRPEATPRRSQENRSVRVDADKLDALIDLVGELVIASAGVNLAARRRTAREVLESATVMQRLVEEVRDGALKLRMVPIGDTFGRFRRVVHDLGRELGKEVDLALSGTDTELDKAMVEKLSDPLMHLVRNALDHGIESPAVRTARGKPARGTLRLNAYHDSGSIVVEVADDGAGLDRERILRRAVERGLLAPGQVPTDREIHRLVMEPGFSTADGVSSVSGRGVGMDVVRRNVEALRGSVAIATAPGQGSTFSIRMPLTLAIIEGFVVGVGDATYVMPLEVVVECLELSAADRARVQESGFINLRGEVLPVLRLREVFDTRGEGGRRENVVVVQYAGQRAGFVVDALLGEFQTVIKPLGKLFERLAGFSGSTILGTGEVGLILDVPALVGRAVIAAGAYGEQGGGQRRTETARGAGG